MGEVWGGDWRGKTAKRGPRREEEETTETTMAWDGLAEHDFSGKRILG